MTDRPSDRAASAGGPATARYFEDDPAAPTPNTPRTLGVCVGLLSPDAGAVLLEHRSDCDFWGILGGGMDDGETAVACLRRELREETGLEVTDVELVGVWTDPGRIGAYADGNVRSLVSVVFAGRLAPGEIRLSPEARAMRYVPWGEIDLATIVPTQRGIVRFLRDRRPGEVYVD